MKDPGLAPRACRVWLRVSAASVALLLPNAGFAQSAAPAASNAPSVASGTPAPAGSNAPAASNSPAGSSASSALGQQAVPPALAADPLGAAEATSATCSERLPENKARPHVTESFPSRALSGHAATLEITIEHGKGETVLPTGFQLQASGPEFRALKAAGFTLPHPGGGAGPLVERSVKNDVEAVTRVKIPLLVLPEKPGRQELTLPPLPVAIARASGDVITLCTAPHTLTSEDPTANTPNPSPRENLQGRSQREEWTAAKQMTLAGLVALAVGALLAWLIGKWRRRPKVLPPPPPPRPPWEVALEALARIRGAGLIREQRFAEHFDQVSDALRRYLGDRYGFDGLESTTREALSRLRRLRLPARELRQIETFLDSADLVKFARLTPTEADCELALGRGEEIVRVTMTAALPTVSEPEVPMPSAASHSPNDARPSDMTTPDALSTAAASATALNNAAPNNAAPNAAAPSNAWPQTAAPREALDAPPPGWVPLTPETPSPAPAPAPPTSTTAPNPLAPSPAPPAPREPVSKYAPPADYMPPRPTKPREENEPGKGGAS